MTSQWAEHEKRTLLAEIIKSSNISLEILLDVIKESQIQPDWNEVVTPNGRNVKASSQIYQQLINNYTSPRNPGLQQVLDASSFPARKRPFSPEPPRPLQPKPAANGVARPARSSSMSAPPRKRGRPSNASKAAKEAEDIARGEIQIAPKEPTRRSLGAAPLSDILGPTTEDEPVKKDFSGPSVDAERVPARKRGRPKKSTKLGLDNSSTTGRSVSVELGDTDASALHHTTAAEVKMAVKGVLKEDELQSELAAEEETLLDVAQQ